MKKLLITLLVLFMAPAASAVTASLSFTGELPGPGGIELAVVSGYYDTYIAMVIEDPGVLSNFTYGPACPPIFTPQPVTIGDDSGWFFGFPATCESGVWLTADWSSTVPVRVGAYETLDFGATWNLLDEIQVPEPMTIALLGLGGMFLLRRRK